MICSQPAGAPFARAGDLILVVCGRDPRDGCVAPGCVGMIDHGFHRLHGWTRTGYRGARSTIRVFRVIRGSIPRSGWHRYPRPRRDDIFRLCGSFRLLGEAVLVACACPAPVAIRCATKDRTRRGWQAGNTIQSPFHPHFSHPAATTQSFAQD
jgi:hypothetical protein